MNLYLTYMNILKIQALSAKEARPCPTIPFFNPINSNT